jgi:hypothetical protein
MGVSRKPDGTPGLIQASKTPCAAFSRPARGRFVSWPQATPSCCMSVRKANLIAGPSRSITFQSRADDCACKSRVRTGNAVAWSLVVSARRCSRGRCAVWYLPFRLPQAVAYITPFDAASKMNDHPTQCRVETGTHVQWIDRQPDLIDTDHASHSRSHAAHCAASDVGQLTVIDWSARRTSTRISAVRAFLVSSGNGTNAGAAADGTDTSLRATSTRSFPSACSTQRRSRFAFGLCATRRPQPTSPAPGRQPPPGL